MRRGETARIFETCNDLGDLYTWFLQFLAAMEAKVGRAVVCIPEHNESGCLRGPDQAGREEGFRSWGASDTGELWSLGPPLSPGPGVRQLSL